MRNLQREEGALEAVVLIASFVLAAVTLVLSVVGLALIGHEQANTAADFAALAGAQTQECSAAAEAARRNGAALRSCTLDRAEAHVLVAIPTRASAALVRLGVPTALLAAAHAGL